MILIAWRTVLISRKHSICLKVGFVEFALVQLILITYYLVWSTIHCGRHMPCHPIFIRR